MGDSKKITVRCSPRSDSKVFRRAPFLAGRNPTKTKDSVGRPEALRAAMNEHGPGIGTTRIPFSKALRTIRYPGSEIQGVPASLTRAICFQIGRASCRE